MPRSECQTLGSHHANTAMKPTVQWKMKGRVAGKTLSPLIRLRVYPTERTLTQFYRESNVPQTTSAPSVDFALHARLSRSSAAKANTRTSRAPWVHTSITYRAQI